MLQKNVKISKKGILFINSNYPKDLIFEAIILLINTVNLILYSLNTIMFKVKMKFIIFVNKIKVKL